MKTILLYILLFPFSLISSIQPIWAGVTSQPAPANCNASTSGADLDIANVRAKVWINGDMWWDLSSTAIYEVPKGSGKSSLFAGALWIGGKDAGGNLKIAAQTYRQSGSDFWPGTIDTTNTSIDPSRCLFYDQHWKITRQEVADFINGGTPTAVITNWPGNGNPAFGEANILAPFHDANGDGIYDITNGDYPKYEFGIQSPDYYNRLNGDQTIWWVFNDVGNVHTETNTNPIGVEIQAQAYAFCTNDSDLANATFYTLKIINRNPATLFETYIGTWTDVDLGFYLDDYVGCDVGRNLGYAYNGDNFDEGAKGYGSQLPAVGIDILSGPLADLADSMDNNHNGVVDEPNETIEMSIFHYYNNDMSVTGNPNTANDYYNYMDGKWKNGLVMTYGGTGYDPLSDDSCYFMFPGDSDPFHYGTRGFNYGFHWSEIITSSTGSPNNPGDRRFLMSSGDFTMLGGAVNYITKAAVWASADSSIDSSIARLMVADDRIQSFFDSYFNNIPTCVVTIGIEELSKDEFQIYPVPTIDQFSVRLKDRNRPSMITIYSIDGKQIYSSGKFKDGQLDIDVSTWTPGIYFVRIQSGNKSAVQKISVVN